MTERVLYTLGYSGWKMADIKQLSESGRVRPDLIVGPLMIIDIRYSAWSKAPVWRPDSFERELRARYVPMRRLGNKNYKNGGPIEILDMEDGLKMLRQLPPNPVILMCGCAEPEGCHRSWVALNAFRAGVCDDLFHLMPEKK